MTPEKHARHHHIPAEQTGKQSARERGLGIFNTILPDMPDKLAAALDPVAPDMIRFIIDVAGGEVMTRPGLDLQSREVATIAALAALGNAAPQLAVHMRGGLTSGLAPQQIVDILYLVAVFAGFPAALNGITVAREVFADKAVNFTPEPEQLTDEERESRGYASLQATSGAAGKAVLENMRRSVPAMADLLIRFSYGDVIARSNLSPIHKEVAMIACCCARGGMIPQMQVHMHAALNVGMTQEAILELFVHLAIYTGFPAALNGIAAANEVFEKI
jgi:4-carboxymuconolactone decarboxylase